MADSIQVTQPIRLQHLHKYTSRILLITNSMTDVLGDVQGAIECFLCTLYFMFTEFLIAYTGILNSTLLKSKLCEAESDAHCANS